VVTTASATSKRRRRELSLWPLALIPVVGALVIVGLFALGSHMVDAVSGPDSDRAMLDSLQQDARAVTPPGMHEIALHRHPCGDLGDSMPATVMRDLSLAPRANFTNSRDALLTSYLRIGWHRNPSDPESQLERGDRSLLVDRADKWADTDTLRVEITDFSVPC
jgi:hypothetical protein